MFDALGAKTYVVGNEPDGTNINMGCGSTHIGNLQRLVREKNLDCGFAFDGDADRCIAVDENGMEVHGDYILYVCGKYLKECGRLQNNTVVATIMSNMGLFKAMKREGIEVCVTTVGDKYVNEAMVANGYVLGGEQSGHIIFSKHATTGDGILTSLMLMEVIMETKQSLGQLTEEVKIYPQLLKNVRVADKKTARENPEVVKAVDAVAEALGDDGRILVNGEEMADFVKQVFRKLADVEHVVVIRVAQRHGDDLFVARVAVVHFEHADRAAFHQRHRLDGLRAEHQHVERVAVVCVGARDKAVVGRIVRRGIQHAIQTQQTRCFIHFIFVFAAALDFNHGHKAIGRDERRINIMPNVHAFLQMDRLSGRRYSRVCSSL